MGVLQCPCPPARALHLRKRWALDRCFNGQTTVLRPEMRRLTSGWLEVLSSTQFASSLPHPLEPEIFPAGRNLVDHFVPSFPFHLPPAIPSLHLGTLPPPPAFLDSASLCRHLTPNNLDLPWPLVPFPLGPGHVRLRSLLRLVIDVEQDNQRDRGISPVQLSSPGPPALPQPSRPAATPGALFPGRAWSGQPRRGWGSGLSPPGKGD